MKRYKLPRNYTNVGSYLQEKRTKAGLTQREVSLKLGYSSPQFISNFERGIALPPLKKLRVLVNAYRMPATEITDLILQAERKQMQRVLGVRS